MDAARSEQVCVLLDERKLWFLQDANQVVFRKRFQGGRDRNTSDKSDSSKKFIAGQLTAREFEVPEESPGPTTHSGISPNWTRSCGSTCSSSGLKSCCGESTCPARLTVGALRVGCAMEGTAGALAPPAEVSDAGATGAGAIRLVKPIEPFDNRACTILSSPTLPRVPTEISLGMTSEDPYPRAETQKGLTKLRRR